VGAFVHTVGEVHSAFLTSGLSLPDLFKVTSLSPHPLFSFYQTNSQYLDATLRVTTVSALVCSLAEDEIPSQCNVEYVFPESLLVKKQTE